jgi:hypothetical protein
MATRGFSSDLAGSVTSWPLEVWRYRVRSPSWSSRLAIPSPNDEPCQIVWFFALRRDPLQGVGAT